MVMGFNISSMMIQGRRLLYLTESHDLIFVSVLYCSLHRYDDHTFYPASTDANYDMVGSNKGAGYNMNIAWNWVSSCVCVVHVYVAYECTCVFACVCKDIVYHDICFSA